MPRDVPSPPLWMLGSTGDGAQIAASLGVGFSFAHHINPELAEYAIQVYRSMFKSSPRLDRPRVILALSAICAETSAEAEQLAASLELAWVRLRSGKPSKFPGPEEAANYQYDEWERQLARAAREHFTTGNPTEAMAPLLAMAARRPTAA